MKKNQKYKSGDLEAIKFSFLLYELHNLYSPPVSIESTQNRYQVINNSVERSQVLQLLRAEWVDGCGLQKLTMVLGLGFRV